MPSDFDVSRPRLIRDGSFLERDWHEIARRRRIPNRLGFAYQIAFVRVLGCFPHQEPLEIDGEVLRFAALQMGTDPDAIEDYAERRQTVTAHQRRIRDYLGLRPFDGRAADDLGFLRSEAQRLDRTGSLLMRARQRLRDRQVLAPADSVLRRVLGSARQAARRVMVERMEPTLSASQGERLDGLVDTGDDRFSALNQIKANPPSPSALGMRRLLGRLELIEATGDTTVEIGWINGNYQRVLFNSVRTASAGGALSQLNPLGGAVDNRLILLVP